MKMPVGIGLVPGPRLFSDLLLYQKNILLQSFLLRQKLSINLSKNSPTSDMLGICDALMSSPFNATVLCDLSGLILEAVLSMGVLKSLLYLLE